MENHTYDIRKHTNWIIFIDLFSSSLSPSSITSILVSIPSSEFFISIIVFFSCKISIQFSVIASISLLRLSIFSFISKVFTLTS